MNFRSSLRFAVSSSDTQNQMGGSLQNWEGCEMKQSWCDFEVFSCILLAELRKITRNPIQGSPAHHYKLFISFQKSAKFCVFHALSLLAMDCPLFLLSLSDWRKASKIDCHFRFISLQSECIVYRVLSPCLYLLRSYGLTIWPYRSFASCGLKKTMRNFIQDNWSLYIH